MATRCNCANGGAPGGGPKGDQGDPGADGTNGVGMLSLSFGETFPSPPPPNNTIVARIPT